MDHFDADNRPKPCKPCSQEGITVPALYVVNGVPMCEPCKRNKMEAPRETKQEEKKEMSKEIDWNRIQNRRSSGELVSKIAKELGVSDATIYNHTKAPNGDVPAKKRGPYKKRESAPSVTTNGTYEGILADLTAKRDDLTAAIEAIKKLQ
jgi:hypothetical protein